MIKRLPDIVFLIVVVIALSVFLVVIFSPSFSDWVVDLLGEDRQRIIQCIGWGIVAISVLWGLVTVNRWAGEQVVLYDNSVGRMEVIWEQVKVIGWWIWKKQISIFLVVVGSLGVVFFVVLVLVMFNECIECWAMDVLGVSDKDGKQEVIKFIGLGIAGVLAVFGSVAVSKRANAQVENNKLIEKGHVQERFRAAVEHLSKHETARIASFYEFYYLARDNDDLQENIFDILCAYLRQTTTAKKYKKRIGFVDEGDNSEVRPTEEVQSLLDILFQSKHILGKSIFVRFTSNLREIFLVKANLRKAYLYNADLRSANLQNADLYDADLRGANLQNADLQSVDLTFAKLRQAKLRSADLQKACLRDADLYRANLSGADLRGADLRRVDLQTVRNLETANLSKAKIKGTIFPKRYKPPADADTTSDD